MIEKIITTLIGCIVIGVFGFLVGKIKTIKNEKGFYLKENKTQSEAIKSLLRASMVSTYYRYKKEKRIPYYERENWGYEYESYKKLGGNSFIDDLKVEIDSWEIGE